MTKSNNSVSVIIPTIGRPELSRAIASVRFQEFGGNLEIIAVFDLEEESITSEVLARAEGADRILFTGGGKKAGYARNRGIEQASNSWIALLDDDDEWLPRKLAIQFDAVQKESKVGELLVVGSRAIQRSSDDPRRPEITGVPVRLIEKDERIEDYLFVSRRPGSRRNSFFAPSILAPTALCRSVPWDESLGRHQDWDWMIRLGRIQNVRFVQVPAEALIVYIGSGGSISAGKDWKGSMEWASRVLEPHNTRAFVDFLAAQTLRYAFHKRDVKGVLKVIRTILSQKKMPTIQSLCVGMSGLLPRDLLERLMHRVK